MESKVTWQGRMTFNATADSGFNMTLGTDLSVGGDNDGFRPMEMIAVGLAGCTAMDVISILQKKRMDVTAFEVQTHLDRANEHPKVFTNATLEYIVSGHEVEEGAVKRAIELSATRYCPAQAMLGQVFPIEMKYKIYELQSDGSQTLVTQGTYVASADSSAS